MKKIVVTLAVNDYAPAVTAITFPLMEAFAAKISADFHALKERKFVGWPVTVEKLQCREIALAHDWTIFLDADVLVHPDTFDFTEHVSKDTVVHHQGDISTARFASDRFFRRDGRFRTGSGFFTAASDWCADIWDLPTDLSLPEVLARITPSANDVKNGARREHLVDEYLVTRNTAKYGIKVTTFIEMCLALGRQPTFFSHAYGMPDDQKVAFLKGALARWGLA